MDNEMTIFTIIAHSGEAKSFCMEAISHAKKGDINQANQCMQEADKKLALAHECQTTLIQAEAQGSETKLSLLLIHAQDHLMNTMTIRALADEFIELYERMNYSSCCK